MSGGTWTNQNKVLPGVYIRFKAAEGAGLTVGERGTVAICEPLSWGAADTVQIIEAGADYTPFTGYSGAVEQNRFLQEIFKGSNRTPAPNKVLLYRPAGSGAAKAAATQDGLTVTALYPGLRGNDISVIVVAETDETYTVQTVVDNAVVDEQNVAAAADLQANAWVKFAAEGEGELAANISLQLTGGADGTISAPAYAAFLTAIEPYAFDILIYDGSDKSVVNSMVTFIKRIADGNGQYAQLVAANLTNPDSRYVINVTSGVIMDDGTVFTPEQTCWWVGGAEAGARYNDSLTNAVYPNAVGVQPLQTNGEKIAAVSAGNLIMFVDGEAVRVVQDINSLITFTPDIGKVYHKNRVMRLCNTIANDIYAQFMQNFIGIVNNNEAGRSRFKSAIVGYLLDIQSADGIQNFSPDDVEVLPGNEIDAVVINLAIQAVDAAEKIYMTVTVA